MNVERYVKIHQQWELVDKRRAVAMAPPTTPCEVHAGDLRRRAQQARVEQGWSIHDLAERIESEPSCIAAFERGDSMPCTTVQDAIARALKLK